MLQPVSKRKRPWLSERVDTLPGWWTLPSCVFFSQIIHLIHSYIYYKGSKMGGSCSTYEADEKWIYNLKGENVSRRIQFHVVPFIIIDIIMILVNITFRLERTFSSFHACRLGLLFNAEDEGSKFLRNISVLILGCIASHPGRQFLFKSPLRISYYLKSNISRGVKQCSIV